MTLAEKNPIDPFENIELGNFKNKSQPNDKKDFESSLHDKEIIKKIASESQFQSRESKKELKKPKLITKTFSLFQDECVIINDVIKAYLNKVEDSMSQPSGSDVVRAALHSFSQKSSQEQLDLVKQHRGRGRR